MGSFIPTKEQENAIHAKGTLLVSAAAGSGKTAVLVERVIGHITDKDNPTEADRLLIVTFTNAAAAEMRSRIAARIAEEIHKNPNNQRLQRQQILLSKANICTIDSFCINLVRENFHALNLSPDFKIADESILNGLRMQAMDFVIDGFSREETRSFASLLEILGADSGDDNLRAVILKIYQYLRTVPFPESWMDAVRAMYDSDLQCSSWLETIFGYADSLVESLMDHYGFHEVLSDPKQNLKAIHTAIKEHNWDEARRKIEAFGLPRMPAVLKQIKTETDDTLKKLRKIFCCAYSDGVEDVKLLSPVVDKLLQLVAGYTEKLMEYKAAKKCLDFADIEFIALRLLCEQRDGETVFTPFAAELHQRYDEVLVDEYQDTNDLQDTIFKAVSDGGKKLFMVGDVKQSIYRFRQANPANFLKYHDEFPVYDGFGDKGRITLSNNFRSREDICDFVNFAFSLLMTKKAGEMDYTKEERLVASAVFPDNHEHGTELYLIDTTDCDDKKEIIEARFIARYIQETMGRGELLRDKNGGLRKANYSDFTILLRNKSTKAAAYVKELKAAGIPVWADISGGFLQAREILTVVSLLRVLDNPLRDVPLLNTMLSPIFGFSPDELAEIRVVNKKEPLYRVVYAARKENKKIAAFLERLQHMKQVAASVTAHQLISYLYEETGYLSIVQAMDNGSQRRANLLLLMDYARGFETGGYKGLSGFLRFVDRLGNEDTALASASVLTEADDVVNIMTIHRSKGLQFPICILAGVSSKINRQDIAAPLLLQEKSGIGLRVFDDQKRIRYSTIPREAIAIELEAASVSEELRVLYVALTRAEDKLVIVSGERKPGEKLTRLSQKLTDGQIDPITVLTAGSYSDWLLSAALLHPSGTVLRQQEEVSITPMEAEHGMKIEMVDGTALYRQEPEVQHTEPVPYDENLLMEIEQRLSFVYPYEKLNGIAAKMTASKIAAKEIDSKYFFTARPAFLSGEKLTPAQKGTAMHLFMQYADFVRAAEDISSELVRITEEGFLTPAQMQVIDVFKLKRFFQSELYKRIRGAEMVYKEYKFMIEMKAREADDTITGEAGEETIVIQGIADLVFIEDGGIVIVDYKTDRTGDISILVEHYTPQLRVYEKALGEVLGLSVKESVLYSLYLGQAAAI